MDREIYLVNTRGNKFVGSFCNESAVGGNRTLKAKGCCVFYKARQLGMCKRLTHNVKIYVVGDAYQLIGNQAEFLKAHSSLLPYGAGTEGAIPVTYISYFNIYS